MSVLSYNQLIKLSKMAATPSDKTCYSFEGKNYGYEDCSKLLRFQLDKLAGNWYDFQDNKNMLYRLVGETIDEIIPAKVLNKYNDVAETRKFAQGEKCYFEQKVSRQRAKQFITRVGLNGRYEVFRLDNKSMDITTSAIGGAARIGFEEFLDGRVDWAEITNIVMEGMDELIYREIAQALFASMAQLPAPNKAVVNGFNAATMDRLLAVAGAYSENVPIICSKEFASKILPDSTAWAYISQDLAKQAWEQERPSMYKGHSIIAMPQSFEDETNTKKVIDPGYAFLLAGADKKPVKIAIEGNTIVNESENTDQSREMQVYLKVGVGVMQTNANCCYQDTSLAGKMTYDSSTGAYA